MAVLGYFNSKLTKTHNIQHFLIYWKMLWVDSGDAEIDRYSHGK